MVFVENVFLHGQNGKKSKKVRVLGIFKSDPGDCFLDPHKNRITGPIFYFFFLKPFFDTNKKKIARRAFIIICVFQVALEEAAQWRKIVSNRRQSENEANTKRLQALQKEMEQSKSNLKFSIRDKESRAAKRKRDFERQKVSSYHIIQF